MVETAPSFESITGMSPTVIQATPTSSSKLYRDVSKEILKALI